MKEAAPARTSVATFQPLIERSPEIIFVHRGGSIVYINPAGARALGHDHPDDLQGEVLDHLVHPDRHQAFSARIQQMLETGAPSACEEFQLVCKDGRALSVELTGVPIIFEDEPAIVSFARDLTERKHIQAKILQTDRLVALGTLAAGVAHEINNPLTYVLANLELVSGALRSRADEYRELRSVPGEDVATTLDNLVTALRVAHDGADRVRKIVRDLTTFARAGEDRRVPLDLRSVLEPMINLTWNEIRHRARLVRDFRQVPLIDAPEARIGQVFLNLLLNAAQAIPDGDAESHEIGITTYTDAAGRAVVEVRDTGAGIPPELMGRIFEPFFTTKPPGMGTGLGLSICHGAVTALGGEIAVESELGRGSMFRVAIPPADLEGRRSPSVHQPPLIEVADVRVLVVDDEPLVGETLRRMLRGNEVEVVTRGREALALVLDGRRFDVILCDLMMPVMTGMDLHAELSIMAPEQAARMIFMTGAAFTSRSQAFLDDIKNPRLDKPINAKVLRAAVHEMVGATPR
ncbi:MAG: ATP-binding protein [Minicystis sp.]